MRLLDQMLARCLSASIHGLDARAVTVEVDLAPGLPGLQLVGLPDKAIQESRERVRAALRNSGFRGPLVKVVVNLAPADLRKEGPAFDLPIALALLVASGQLDAPLLKQLWCAGELGLDGALRPCRGVLAIASLAGERKARALIVPAENAREAMLVRGLAVQPAQTLAEVVSLLREQRILTRPISHQDDPLRQEPSDEEQLLTSPLQGCSSAQGDSLAQTGFFAQTALALVASGGHHLLMVGPPGCGKTLLARQLPHLLPSLSREEALEITRIHSAAGHLRDVSRLLEQRPFREPHHSCSAAALLGGGRNPRPGELSLAHRGVLFLDELAEFPRAMLDQLRQPLEDGVLRLSRAQQKCSFPCRITLIAATNPCPCGWHGDPDRACLCSQSQRRRYWQRISGPLLDRLDLQLRMERLPAGQLRKAINNSASQEIGDRQGIDRGLILQARARMFRRNPEGRRNAGLSAEELGTVGQFDDSALTLWENVSNCRHLSARSGLRLLRVARSLADLQDQDQVSSAQIAEATCFTSLEDWTQD